MTGEQRTKIRTEYLDGGTGPECARAAGVTEIEAETYLRWWCDRGCPGAVRNEAGEYHDSGADQ